MESVIKMFGPLSLDETPLDLEIQTPCLLCDDQFNLNLGFTIFLKHCFEVHHLIIDDVQNIADLQEYLKYWKGKFSQVPLERLVPFVEYETIKEELCLILSAIPSVEFNSVSGKYFMLSTLIKEDKELRHKLKLNTIMKQQEFERTDRNFKKMCLFCRNNLEGLRSDYINHLTSAHNLLLGNPQNLVYVDELIARIEDKLNFYQCIFCEKIFPNREVLKEHMRKKNHKRINPQNKFYDRFYIVNYLEEDMSWKAIEKERDVLPVIGQEDSDEEYSDWKENEMQIICLFCPFRKTSITDLCAHMSEDHKFNFSNVIKNLEYYKRVKLVNYIRRQMHNFHCILCDELHQDHESLTKHMVKQEHYKVPDLNVFDLPEFYFPTFENDAFLYYLEDIDEE